MWEGKLKARIEGEGWDPRRYSWVGQQRGFGGRDLKTMDGWDLVRYARARDS